MSPTTERPSTVTAAFWLILIGLVFDLIGAVTTIVGGAALAAMGGSAPAGAAAGVLIVGIMTLVLVVIELIVVFKLRNGKNWARVVITILEALGLLILLSGMGLTQVLAAAISVVIIVLLWVPASNAYFAARR